MPFFKAHPSYALVLMKIVLFPASLSSLWTTLSLRFSSSRARSCALTPSSPARAPLPSEVSDPIVTIETFKITYAPEEGSKKTASASKVLPSAAVSSQFTATLIHQN